MSFLTDEEIDRRIAMKLNRSDGLANVNQQQSIRPSWMPPIEPYESVDSERTLGGTLKDVGVSIGKGIVGTGQAAIGLADIVTPGQLGKGLESAGVDLGAAQEYLSEQYTPAQKAAFERVEEAKGFLPTLGTMVQNPSTIVHSVIESLPAVAGGGLVGRGALALAPRIGGLAAGAIGEGAVTAGQTAEGIREQSDDRTISGKQVLMALGAGAGTGALGLVGGAIARKFGVGDIDTMLASKQFAEKSNKGVVRRILEGGISEGAFEELPQSIQEQVWMNAATGKDLTEGIGEAGAAGLLVGTAMGGGANVFTSQSIRDNAGIKDQTDWNQYFQDYELQELNNEYQNIQTAKQAATTPEEQAIIKQRQDQIIDQLHERKESVDAQNGIVKTPEEIQRERAQRQFEYEQLFGLPAGVKSAQESAETILAQKPLSDIEQAQKDRQRQIEETYLPAEEEVDRINQYRLAETEQAGEPEPVPLRSTDLITRNGQPYQRREYLEGYLEALPNGNDYEIVSVPNGFIARLTDEALDPRRDRIVWEDETGRYPSERAYWNAQKEAIRRQQETPLQTVTNRRVPFEEILPRSNQAAIEATEYDVERTVPIGEGVTQPEVTPAVTEVEQPVESVGAGEEVTPEEEPLVKDVFAQQVLDEQQNKGPLMDSSYQFMHTDFGPITASIKRADSGKATVYIHPLNRAKNVSSDLAKNMSDQELIEFIYQNDGKISDIRSIEPLRRFQQEKITSEESLVNYQIQQEEKQLYQQQRKESLLKQSSGKSLSQMTLNEFSFQPEAEIGFNFRNIPNDPIEWTKDNLANGNNTELVGVAKFLGIPFSGNKTTKIDRILKARDIRAELANATIDDLYPNKDKKTLAVLYQRLTGKKAPARFSKVILAEQILNLRDKQREAGQRALAEVNYQRVQNDSIREDFQAREDLISEMESELEANQIEQDRLGVDDPRRTELELNAEELRRRIRNDRRELLIDRLGAGPQFQIVYHGSPHEWQSEPGFPYGRPRLDKIGSGEGATIYGWGWYSAEVEDVAKDYQEALTDKDIKGSLYKLDIPDSEIPKLLSWDKKIKDQPYVLEKLKSSGLLKEVNDYLDYFMPHLSAEEMFGSDFYKRVGRLKSDLESPNDNVHAPAASEYLASIGIPGNKYFDQRSRIDQDGTYNYVIWDQNVLDKIALLERNQNKLAKLQTEVRSKQEPGQGISLPEIQKMYKGQEVFQGDDGAISIRFKNGAGATIQNIQDAGNGFISYAIDTGQMSKDGKILGVTTGANILLDSEFADNATLWHENKHVLDNLGMITERDNALLNKEFNKLRKTNRLGFALSTHEDPRLAREENRANTFAQIMLDRENYRGTALGKVIQKIMDFFNGLLGIGRQTLGRFVREVESGRIYERPSVDQPVIGYHRTTKDFTTFTKKDKSEFSHAGSEGFYFSPIQDDPTTRIFGPNEIKASIDIKQPATPIVLEGYPPIVRVPIKLTKKEIKNDIKTGITKRGGYITVPKGFSPEMGSGYKFDDSWNLPNTDSYYLINPESLSEKDVAYLKKRGYDGIKWEGQKGITSPAQYVAFDPKQIKIQKDEDQTIAPQFQVADLTKPEQKISDNVYRDIYEQQSSLVEKLNQNIKKTGREINRGMNKYLGMISTNLKKINPMLEAKVRKLGFDTTMRIKDDLTVAKPLLDKLKDMSSQDKSDWHWARVNGDAGKIRQITDKYGMTDDYNNVRESLNRIRRDGEAVGYNIGFIDEYWPRILKDRTGFLQATRELSNEPVFSRALKAQADKQGITVDALDDGLKADIISNIILGRPSGLGGPVNIRQRYFAEVPPEFAKFYMDSDAALMSYIYSMNKKIEARKFFGKVPERIARIKKDKRTKETRLANLTRLESDLVADGQDITTVKEQINGLVDDIQIAQNELDKYGRQDDFKENIGSYVMDLMVQEKIKPGTGVKENDEQALKDILTARFNEKGTTGLANVYKNLAYIDTMGNPISAITQLGDLAWAVYVGGLTPIGIANSVRNIGKAILGKSDITREDIGITRIAQEFADGDTLSNAVSKIFKIVGIEKLDRIGKEALINNSFDNYRAKAEIATRDAKEMERFKKELRPLFGTKSEKVINDLLDPNVAEQSDDVKLLVYSRLLDFQPADLSETPEAYLNAGNGRLFYMLKMFTLKQFDVFRREVWHNIKTGERDKVLAGLGNMTRLMAVLSLANAGADELKDWVLGKDTKFEDHVIENLLSLGGASRYLRMQTTREGIGSGLAGQILPPFKFIDAISKDVMTDTRDGLRSVDSIPVGGKLYYWHFGRGKDDRESVEEKDFAKESKKIRKFKKDFDAADDKRLFLRSNLDQFKQMKFYDNMTKALRGNKATINKLKDIEQTPNVRKRLSQLEQQRKDLINRYFEMKNNL